MARGKGNPKGGLNYLPNLPLLQVVVEILQILLEGVGLISN